jgi:hypothetical protein
MKQTLLILLLAIFLIGSVSAFVTTDNNNLYIDLNRTYPLVLIPLDENVWNITLWVYEESNWSDFNFTWTGSQYELSLLFTEVGDYPFVVNSTEVIGEIAGIFFVREPYNVTFKFYKDKASTIFSSNEYINNFAYLTAELTGEKNLFKNNYDPYLEPFIVQISDDRFLKPVFHSQYTNGKATLKLYEQREYAIRLIDGEISFSGIYSVPNITKSYGTNVYVGKYTFTNSTSNSYNLILTEKDLTPFKWLFNIVYIILIIGIFVTSIFLFFIVPEKPALSVIFGLGFIGSLTLIRIILWIYWG